MKKDTFLMGLILIFLSAKNVSAQADKPASPPPGFIHKYATVNGVKIHYVTGGKGEPLLLIHGFGQNWFMWARIMPALSKHFTMIAPTCRVLENPANLKMVMIRKHLLRIYMID